MQFSTSITAVMATASLMLATTISSQGTTISSAPTITRLTPITFESLETSSAASVAISNLAATLSAQLANPSFQAEVSKLTVSKPSELKGFIADVTSLVHDGIWGTATKVSVPAWMNALHTTGYAYSAIHGDVSNVYEGSFTEIKSDAKGIAFDLSSITASVASALNPSLGAKGSSLASSLTASLESKASSIASSVGGKPASVANSLTSSLASQISSATATGGAHAQAQATGGVMAMGAVLGGVIGVAVLL